MTSGGAGFNDEFTDVSSSSDDQNLALSGHLNESAATH